MRKACKFLTVLLTTVLLAGLCPISAFAQAYTYKVTLYAGNQGLFTSTNGITVSPSAKVSAPLEGGNKVVIENLKQDDKISVDVNACVTLKEESQKYYVQGVRRSGFDNDNLETSYVVTGDDDLVVAYGIKGDMIEYTIDYVKADTTQQLINSRTFYAKAGDKVVVSAPYIEGYVPDAYAKTMTITSSRNHFTFEYREGEVQIIQLPGETITTVITRPTGGTTTGGTTTGGTTTGGTTTAGTTTGNTAQQTTPGAQGGEEADNQPAQTQPDQTQPDQTQPPQEIVDLDDEDVPQANVDLEEEEQESGKEEMKKGFPVAAGIVVSVVAIAALVGMIIFLRRHRR